MMSHFLANNRDDLIARCKVKVAQRPRRDATPLQLANGVPLFLDQLTRTLEAEEGDEPAEGLRISGPSGGDSLVLSEMGVSAAAHGKELLKLGFTVAQVVHDYGDLCQAITDLAFERDAPFAIDEFRTLNRCLDNAIADAVTEFSELRDATLAGQNQIDANERLGFLAHELRNALGTATLAVSALELGNMTMGGATGAVLKRSLAALDRLVSRSIDEVRGAAAVERRTFSLAAFISDAQNAGQLDASATGSPFTVMHVDPALGIYGNRELLLAALANVLQNAFKFTRPRTEVTLNALAFGAHVIVEISDHCGGLATGVAEAMFAPFAQRSSDKSGLGLGLSIARQSVEADGGTLSVRNVPNTGCIFTICLPRHTLH
jgi:signal transduction histidine kinase